MAETPEETLSINFSHHEIYFKIAKDNLSKAIDFVYERSEKIAGENQNIEEAFEIDEQIYHARIVTVVFSALTAEAFINHYASMKFPKDYRESYLDKLDLVAKWIIIPKLAVGKSFETNSAPINCLKKLKKLRNRFVHDKTITMPLEKYMESHFFYSIEEAEKSVGTIRHLIEALKAIDDTVETKWLNS